MYWIGRERLVKQHQKNKPFEDLTEQVEKYENEPLVMGGATGGSIFEQARADAE